VTYLSKHHDFDTPIGCADKAHSDPDSSQQFYAFLGVPASWVMVYSISTFAQKMSFASFDEYTNLN
jgi:hypothetical protein